MVRDNLENTPNLDDIIEDSLYYQTFFGESSDYYEERYNRFETAGEKFIFNPYAFFLGFFWLSYRKMYIEIVIILLITLTIESLLIFVLDIDNPSLDRAFNILWMVIIGGGANHLYFKKAKKTVIKAKEMYVNTGEQLDYLEREGGTSYVGPVIVGVLSFAVFIGSIFLYEYTGVL